MDSSVIGILNTCFWICLSFAVLFFIVSLIMFFAFDIMTIFNIKTGRAQAKTVKEMKTANERTGRLRIDGKTQTSKLSEEEINSGRAPAVIPPEATEQNQYYDLSESVETEVLKPSNNDIDYNSNSNNVFAETSVLSNAMNNTDDIASVNNSDVKLGFEIVKNILLIHTEEII